MRRATRALLALLLAEAVALAALVASAQPHGVSQSAPAVTAAVTVSDRPCETVIVIEGALP